MHSFRVVRATDGTELGGHSHMTASDGLTEFVTCMVALFTDRRASSPA